MTNLLYRNSTNPSTPGSTSFKGSALSFDELDGNFKSLSDDIGTREIAANKNVAFGYAGLSATKALQLINTAGTFTSVLQNAASATRTYTMKDADGTVAFTSDITGTNSGTNTGDNSVNSLYSGLAASKQDVSAKDAATGYVGISAGYQINFKNSSNTFLSLMTNANTASRTYTFPNRTGTIADDTDLAGKQTTLVAGTSIKTINGTTLLGGGDLALQVNLVSSSNIKTVNGTTLLGGGDLAVAGLGANTFSGIQVAYGFDVVSSAIPVNGMNLNAATTLGWSTGSIVRLTLNGTGDLTATGNVGAYSDERLKTNWRDLPSDFARELSLVKTGIYDRLDQDMTQVGVSAQSLQQVMPNAVMTDEFGMLSVSYGQAAMAACVMLAREIQALKSKG